MAWQSGEGRPKTAVPSVLSKGSEFLYFKPPTIPNSIFGYILSIIDVHTQYITFPGINPLDTVRCDQILNNDYSILEKGIYCQALGIVGRSPAYSRLSLLAEAYQNL